MDNHLECQVTFYDSDLSQIKVFVILVNKRNVAAIEFFI